MGHTQQEERKLLDIICCSSEQTQQQGVSLGQLLQGGELILLAGQLGSGKTTFTQGLARGMGIAEVVSSPTFTLLKEYTAPMPTGRVLYHFDLYRLDHPAEEIIDLGFEDYFSGSGICVVEWADRVDHFWPTEGLSICLNIVDETMRGLLFTATGRYYCELLKQFQKNTDAATRS